MKQLISPITHRLHKWVGYVAVMLVAAGCSAQASEVPATTSMWGRIITVGEAEQANAPSVAVTENRFITTWIGADKTGIHQDIRSLDANGLSERVVLPLPPKNPFDQTVLPAPNQHLHLLWLDQTNIPETHLYSAVITPAFVVERGPIKMTDEPTLRYASVSNADGSVWVVTSGGMTSQPGLYGRYIDIEGRFRLQESYQLVTDGDWPTLAKTNDGTTYLFWIQPSDGHIMRATLTNGVVENTQAITETIVLNPGDRLTDFSAGLDRTHAYLFWNITRADGKAETWFASGMLNAETWEQPQRLGISITSAPFETGFNSGAAQAASTGDAWLSWTAAMSGEFDTLAAATLLPSGQLGILYFQDGAVAGVQEIVAVTPLIGLPTLSTDRDRFLYLTWSEHGNQGQAGLRMTTSRGSP